MADFLLALHARVDSVRSRRDSFYRPILSAHPTPASRPMTTNPKFHSFFEKSAQSMKESILHQLKFSLAHDVHSATKRDWWLATSKAVQERIIERMIATQAVHNQQDVRRVYYLSLEFLMGRLFSNSLYNAGVYKETEQALKELGLDME